MGEDLKKVFRIFEEIEEEIKREENGKK